MVGMRFEAPESVDAAISLLAGTSGDTRVLAGGTDLLVKLRADMIEPELVVDIKRIAETRTVIEKKKAGSASARQSLVPNLKSISFPVYGRA